MSYRVKFYIEVAKPKSLINGLEYERTGTLPFIPTAGMMLSAFKGDDYREVEKVYWDCEEPDLIHVHFKFTAFNTPTLMRRCGWKEEA